MSKNMKKQSTTMEDYGSLRYHNREFRDDFFDRTDCEVSLILLELSHPIIFSSHSSFLPKWGHTKKRSTSVSLHTPEISPVIKSMPSTEVGEMGSTSSSSCLTGEAKKTNHQRISRGLEEEYSTKNQRTKPSNVLKAETGLLRGQVGLVANKGDDQNLHHLRDVETASLPQQASNSLEVRGFDLNLPATEESNGIVTTNIVGFQRVATNLQAAAQARQRRLGLIRSKKLYTRFFSPYQFK